MTNCLPIHIEPKKVRVHFPPQEVTAVSPGLCLALSVHIPFWPEKTRLPCVDLPWMAYPAASEELPVSR